MPWLCGAVSGRAVHWHTLIDGVSTISPFLLFYLLIDFPAGCRKFFHRLISLRCTRVYAILFQRGMGMETVHSGHRERLRERFIKTNLEGYAPHEVLELLLTYAIPRRDTNPIAHALLERFGSLHKVLEAPQEELEQVEGVGESAAVLIRLVLPMMRHYLISCEKEKATLNAPDACKAYARGLLMGERVEHVEAVALDARSRVIGRERVASGDEGEAAVSVRRVMAFLLRTGAAQAVICHNHPDGAAEPSEADILWTKEVRSLMAAMQIYLLDHIIIAGSNAYSFRENGRFQS